jgi:hypothetical protein
MPNHVDSETSPNDRRRQIQFSGWVRLAIVAGASLFAGGIATALWYRRTLEKLHQADHTARPESRDPRDDEA